MADPMWMSKGGLAVKAKHRHSSVVTGHEGAGRHTAVSNSLRGQEAAHNRNQGFLSTGGIEGLGSRQQ